MPKGISFFYLAKRGVPLAHLFCFYERQPLTRLVFTLPLGAIERQPITRLVFSLPLGAIERQPLKGLFGTKKLDSSRRGTPRLYKNQNWLRRAKGSAFRTSHSELIHTVFAQSIGVWPWAARISLVLEKWRQPKNPR